MRRFRSFNHSACKAVLNGGDLFEIVVERVTVVKFRVDNRGSDGTGCFGIEVRTDTAELSDTCMRLRKCTVKRPLLCGPARIITDH